MSPAVPLALLLFTFVPMLQGGDIGLIRISESWRYFKGVQEPPPEWKDSQFIDNSWAEGKSGFSNLGGFGEQTTFSDYNSTYSTVYFRKRFIVDDPARIQELVLRLDYDDGFVAFLNGREVARRGVAGPPDSAVPFNATSTVHFRGLTEEMSLNDGIAQLVKGENTLAFQIHGSGAGDWSMAFVPELLANFTRTPYVQNNTSNSVQVAWKTYSPTAGRIEFGLTISNTTSVEIDTGQTNHLATLTGLTADTRYLYRIGARYGSGVETWSDWSWFRTFKPEGGFSFAVIADTGWATPQQYQVAEQLRRTDVDLIIHGGDLTYGTITDRISDLRVLSVYQAQLRSTPMFVAFGNHDALANLQVALDLFYLPTNQVTGTEHYYSFDHGDVHFVALWSDLAAGSRYHPGSPQYQWLEADLAASNKRWKFIFFHHCWRTSALHRADNYDLNATYDMDQLDALAELAGRHGVQVIFHGHDHAFERFTPRHGVLSYTSGGGGAALYGLSVPHPDSVDFQPRFHFLKVTVHPDVTTVQAIDEHGRLFDATHVSRDFPESQTNQATWHTPVIEARPADDGDGNIRGQTFDFALPSMAARAGQNTSAGRLFVNNDDEFLYLGLDEVLLHPNEEVYLFLETPLPRPAFDATNFGWNLPVTNFQPTIMALLGDEFADSFGSSPDPRQAVRFIREGLPPVPGQRIQQFNRSPQTTPVPYEQNASYIEVALPLDQIGLRPGDDIRVAAMVGTGTNALGVQFDTGGIFRDSQPLLVRLASQPPSDTDADGLADPFENIAGTDPADSSSVLRVNARRTAGGGIEIIWAAVPGKWYRLEYLDRADSVFRDLPHPQFPRRAALALERATLSKVHPHEYYRLVVIPE